MPASLSVFRPHSHSLESKSDKETHLIDKNLEFCILVRRCSGLNVQTIVIKTRIDCFMLLLDSVATVFGFDFNLEPTNPFRARVTIPVWLTATCHFHLWKLNNNLNFWNGIETAKITLRKPLICAAHQHVIAVGSYWNWMMESGIWNFY